MNKALQNRSIQQKVDELLSKMTLEQKIGQMTQAERMTCSPEEAKHFHLGSILSSAGSTPDDNTPKGWVEMNDAYWEASSIENKDFIYDIISLISQEMAELNKLSIQDHHYPYEFISEGIRRIVPKVLALEERQASIIHRTKTLTDMREVLSNVIVILEGQVEV